MAPWRGGSDGQMCSLLADCCAAAVHEPGHCIEQPWSPKPSTSRRTARPPDRQPTETWPEARTDLSPNSASLSPERCNGNTTRDDNPHECDNLKSKSQSTFSNEEACLRPSEDAISQSQVEDVSVLPDVSFQNQVRLPKVAEFLVVEAEASPTQERENLQMTFMQALTCQRIDLQTDCVAG
jgi:hypothetical protein